MSEESMTEERRVINYRFMPTADYCLLVEPIITKMADAMVCADNEEWDVMMQRVMNNFRGELADMHRSYKKTMLEEYGAAMKMLPESTPETLHRLSPLPPYVHECEGSIEFYGMPKIEGLAVSAWICRESDAAPLHPHSTTIRAAYQASCLVRSLFCARESDQLVDYEL